MLILLCEAETSATSITLFVVSVEGLVVARCFPLGDGGRVALHDLWSRRQSTKFNGVSYIVQRGAEAAYGEAGRQQIRDLIAFYLDNARIIRGAFTAMGLEVHGGINAPYVWIKTPGGISSWQFFDKLLTEAHVVGTPGRMMDHLRKGTLKTDKIKALILDEADEMLSMVFIDDIEWILEHMPEERQTALFSATMPPPIRKICDKYLRDPVEITIKIKTSISPNIRQRYLKRRNPEKPETLVNILETEDYDAVLVFDKTKNGTLEVAERLNLV